MSKKRKCKCKSNLISAHENYSISWALQQDNTLHWEEIQGDYAQLIRKPQILLGIKEEHGFNYICIKPLGDASVCTEGNGQSIKGICVYEGMLDILFSFSQFGIKFTEL